MKKRLSLDEAMFSVVHDYGQHKAWILMKRWKEKEDKEQVSVTHTDMKAHTPAHTHTLHSVSTFEFARLCLYDPHGTGNKKVSISPSYLLVKSYNLIFVKRFEKICRWAETFSLVQFNCRLVALSWNKWSNLPHIVRCRMRQ